MALAWNGFIKNLSKINNNTIKSHILINKNIKPKLCNFHRNVWEQFRKGGAKYEEFVQEQHDKLSELDKIQLGYQMLKSEVKWQYDRCRYYADPTLTWDMYDDCEVVKLWDFNKQEDRDNWRTVCDSDWDEGYSKIDYSVSNNNHALLTGNIDTRLPQDGKIIRAGFVYFACEQLRKPFKRKAYFDWHEFTHLIVRCRGDGRTWTIVLNTSGYFDITWGDRHVYNLYTRGGPYWQWSKIPFSKFFLSHRQRVPDNQERLCMTGISQVGFRLSDRQSGPFKLEIDYVGVMRDDNYKEYFAYEMYRTPWRWKDLGEV